MLQELILTQKRDVVVSEQDKLRICESVIERGFNTFIEVGKALLEIRDEQLYKSEFSTFEEYCQERWGISVRHAQRLMQSVDIINNLRPDGRIPILEAHARPLAILSPDKQVEAWKIAVETAPDGVITGPHVQNVVDTLLGKRPVSYHIADESYEWYTPREYIEAARLVLGTIDLDPASSNKAQTVIKAKKYYTKENDGLAHSWFGRIWLNPPYNMPLIADFINRAIKDYESGQIQSAIILTNNSTDTNWFHLLLNFPICFTRRRIPFWGSGGEILATRQGQAITYLGNDLDLFAAKFRKFGAILVKYDYQ